MYNNAFSNNIVVLKNQNPTITNSLYDHYGSGRVSDAHDRNPTVANPNFQTCRSDGADSWSYLLSPSSPAFRSPTNFPTQTVNDSA
jgi:hypothetical protein